MRGADKAYDRSEKRGKILFPLQKNSRIPPSEKKRSSMVRLLFSPDRRLPLVPQAKNRIDPAVLATLAEINTLTLGRSTPPELKGNCNGGSNYLRTPSVAKGDCAPGAWPAPPSGYLGGDEVINSPCQHMRNSQFVRQSKGIRRQFGVDLTNHQHHATPGNILASPGIVSDRAAEISCDSVGPQLGMSFSEGALGADLSYARVRFDDQADAGKNTSLSTVFEASFESSKQNCRSDDGSGEADQGTDSRPLRPRRPTAKNGTDSSECNGDGRGGGCRGVNPRRWHVRSQRCTESPRSGENFSTDDTAAEYQGTGHDGCGRPQLIQQWPKVNDMVIHERGRSQSILLTPGAKCPEVDESVQNTPSAANYISPQPWIRPPIVNPFATPQFTGIEQHGPSNEDVAGLLVDLEEIERRVANRTTPSPSPCPGIAPGKCSPTESVLCNSRSSPRNTIVETTLDSREQDSLSPTPRHDVYKPRRDGRTFDLAVDCGDAGDKCIDVMESGSSRIPEQALPFAESIISVASTISSLSTSSGSGCATKVASLDDICGEASSRHEAGQSETTALNLVKEVFAEDHGSFEALVRWDEDMQPDGDRCMPTPVAYGESSLGPDLTCTRQIVRSKFGMTIIPENQVLFSQVGGAALLRRDEKGRLQDISQDELRSRPPPCIGTGDQQMDCQGGLATHFGLEHGSGTLAHRYHRGRSSPSGKSRTRGGNGAEPCAPTSRLGRSVYMDAYGEWFNKQIDDFIDEVDTTAERRLDTIRGRSLEAFNELVSCPSFDVEMKDTHGNTLFLLTCRAGWRKAARILLKKHGADIAATNKYGNCALHFAKEFGHDKLVAYLLKRGASLAQIKNCRGKRWCERDDAQEEI